MTAVLPNRNLCLYPIYLVYKHIFYHFDFYVHHISKNSNICILMKHLICHGVTLLDISSNPKTHILVQEIRQWGLGPWDSLAFRYLIT